MTALYVENDPFCAEWLSRSIAAGIIADGLVDDRDIREISGDDCRGFDQVHLFAGIGLWSFVLRAAGIGDDSPVWTGSCPCQPFSRAGARAGFADDRHLWPDFHRLVTERRPAVVFGEQVADEPQWLGMVRSDLVALDYAVAAIPIEAASAGARHLRDRFWFVAVADPDSKGLPVPKPEELCGTVGVDEGRAIAERLGRAAEPSVRVMADGHPGRVPVIRAFGNSLDTRPAIQFVKSWLDIWRERC